MWQRVAISAAVMAIGTLAIFRWQLDRTDSERAAQTVALTTMVFYQMLQAINARSETRSIFRIRPTANPYLFGAIVLTILVHGAVVLFEPVGKYLRTEPLDLTAWAASFVVATTILIAVEAHKRFVRSESAG
jgi:Ca2+-transporting ATPase